MNRKGGIIGKTPLAVMLLVLITVILAVYIITSISIAKTKGKASFSESSSLYTVNNFLFRQVNTEDIPQKARVWTEDKEQRRDMLGLDLIIGMRRANWSGEFTNAGLYSIMNTICIDGTNGGSETKKVNGQNLPIPKYHTIYSSKKQEDFDSVLYIGHDFQKVSDTYALKTITEIPYKGIDGLSETAVYMAATKSTKTGMFDGRICNYGEWRVKQ